MTARRCHPELPFTSHKRGIDETWRSEFQTAAKDLSPTYGQSPVTIRCPKTSDRHSPYFTILRLPYNPPVVPLHDPGLSPNRFTEPESATRTRSARLSIKRFSTKIQPGGINGKQKYQSSGNHPFLTNPGQLHCSDTV